MYKAIYPYCHDNPKILSFNAGDKLIVLKQNENNWWLAQKRQGHIGLVPSNYIVSYSPEPLEFLEFIIDSAKGAPYLPMYFSQDCLPLSRKVLECYKDKLLSSHPHLLQYLRSKQVANNSEERLCGESNPNWKHSTSSDDALASPSSLSAAAPESSSRTSSSLSSSNFRLSTSISPPPPITTSPVAQHQFQDSMVSPDQIQKSPQDDILNNSDKDNMSKDENCVMIPRNLFWSLVSQVRDAVNIDFNSSCSVVRLVLDRVGESCPSIVQVMNEILLQESEDHFDGIHNDKGRLESIFETTDAKDLQEIFNELSQTKDDSQQRSWALHEDEESISQMLKKLLSILMNANPEICKMVLAKDNYIACNDLVLYYQMEVRSSLRMLLLEIFANICSLGTNFISELMASILPLELARETQDPATEDPVRIPGLKYKTQNSVMKFLSDMFSHASTSSIFYTNDARVLIDILLRRLIDLNPGDEMRSEYLALTQLVLANSNYFEHKHRLCELRECLNRILDEEENIIVDKEIISKIFSSFKEFFV